MHSVSVSLASNSVTRALSLVSDSFKLGSVDIQQVQTTRLNKTHLIWIEKLNEIVHVDDRNHEMLGNTYHHEQRAHVHTPGHEAVNGTRGLRQRNGIDAETQQNIDHSFFTGIALFKNSC